MRTTIELTEAQRTALLKLASERREKGFSKFIQEAIDLYLREIAALKERVAGAIAVLGSFSDEEADALEQSVAALRGRWR